MSAGPAGAAWAAWAALLGAVAGSFLNVVVYRLPRGLSVVRPGSMCPACERPLEPAELVPLLSYLWLRGRCRGCGAAISPRYPLVELATAGLWWAAGVRFGLGPDFWAAAALSGLVLAAALIDLGHGIIPNRLVAGGLAAGVPILLWAGPARLADGALGLAVAGGLFLGISLAYPGGMGGGDVKLAAVMGWYLGWRLALLALLAGVLLGALVGLALLAARVCGRRDTIPFGPFMAAGALYALFFGAETLAWYWGRLGG